MSNIPRPVDNDLTHQFAILPQRVTSQNQMEAEDYDYEEDDYNDGDYEDSKLELCKKTFMDTQSKSGCRPENYCNYGSLNCIGRDLFCEEWVSTQPEQLTEVQKAIDQSILLQQSEVVPDKCGVFNNNILE